MAWRDSAHLGLDGHGKARYGAASLTRSGLFIFRDGLALLRRTLPRGRIPRRRHDDTFLRPAPNVFALKDFTKDIEHEGFGLDFREEREP